MRIQSSQPTAFDCELENVAVISRMSLVSVTLGTSRFNGPVVAASAVEALMFEIWATNAVPTLPPAVFTAKLEFAVDRAANKASMRTVDPCTNPSSVSRNTVCVRAKVSGVNCWPSHCCPDLIRLSGLRSSSSLNRKSRKVVTSPVDAPAGDVCCSRRPGVAPRVMKTYEMAVYGCRCCVWRCVAGLYRISFGPLA